MVEQYKRTFVTDLEQGRCISEWRGFSPFWLGCFYGDSVINGGEEKYSHCYDFFSGIWDVDWWIVAEINKLSPEEQEEMYQLMVRNKEIGDRITFEVVKELSNILQVDTHHIYRLGNRRTIKLVDALPCSDDVIKSLYKQFVIEVGLNRITNPAESEYILIRDNYTDEDEKEDKFVISYISGHRIGEIKVEDRIYKLITEHFEEDVIEISELLEYIATIAE